MVRKKFRFFMFDQNQEVTKLLNAAFAGDDAALSRIIPLIQHELRRMARLALRRDRKGHTLQPTELVNELYLRLKGRSEVKWENREHFFKVATIALNYILVDNARHRNRKGGPGKKDVRPLEEHHQPLGAGNYSKKLEILDVVLMKFSADPAMKRKVKVVDLRFFVGLTFKEIAEEIGASVTTVKNDWDFSRAWLLREMKALEGYGL